MQPDDAEALLLARAAARLTAWCNPAAACVRWPLRDAESPDSSDLDILVFEGAGEDVALERLPATPELPSLDLMRLPAALLNQPQRLAGWGLVTHRLLSSVPLVNPGGQAAAALAQVSAGWLDPSCRMARLQAFIEMGRLTVQEVGVSEGHPAIALFWLHMAHAACLATLADAAGQLAPNVYTRPLAVASALEAELGQALREPMVHSLRLQADPLPLMAQVEELHALVVAQCPEPIWPAAMRISTRTEYRYWLSPAELQARLLAADEMNRRGDAASAVFYLRYTAYSLARAVMIHARMREGWDSHISYIRPESRVGPDLALHLPRALVLLEQVLGGSGEAADQALAAALQRIQALRTLTLAHLDRRGIQLPAPAPWAPFQPLAS